MKNLMLKSVLAFTALLFLAAGCSKEETPGLAGFETEESWAALERELITVETWADAEDAVTNGRWMAEDEHLRPPDCVTRIWEADPPHHTRVLTIDFGDTWCLGRDGLYRKGLITVTFVGPRGVPGSTKTTEFTGYFVMNHEYNGVKSIEYTGSHTYDRQVDMTLTAGDQESGWYADETVEQVAGYNTPQRYDDILQVTGDGGGIRRNGMSYTALVNEPLLRKLQPGCFSVFVDGTVEFTNADGAVTGLDFDPLGGAPCDKLAAVTRNGETHYITLR